MNDIYEFLPNYPDIDNDENFNYSISRKEEFFDLKLSDKSEENPKKQGTLLPHQKIIRNFLSSHTPYDELLLLHDMGTGKTCSAIGAVENILKQENNSIKKVVILASNKNMLTNIKREIVTKCTLPTEYDNIYPAAGTQKSKDTKIKQQHKLLKEYYEFDTFTKFAKKIKSLLISKQEKQIIKQYSNSCIIMDEVHNIRSHDEDDDNEQGANAEDVDQEQGANAEDVDQEQKSESELIEDRYKVYLNFLHLIRNRKILLLSGTPMKDDVTEIADIMNLILPTTKKIDKTTFMETYFDNTKKANDKIKDKMRGRVSYLRARESTVKKIYEGGGVQLIILPTEGKKIRTNILENFKVTQSKMSDYQTQIYKTVVNEHNGKGFYKTVLQASLFAFPDGVHKDEDFDVHYYLDATSPELKLEKLAHFSQKYSDFVRNVLQCQKDGKLVFAYCESVSKGGVNLLKNILKYFRVPCITITGNTENIKGALEKFNNTTNKHGKHFNVVLGSKAISEGYTLKNIQVIEILTPGWNYTSVAQAIARGIRFGSHEDLKQTNQDINVQIYRRVSVPNPKIASVYSIDLYRYATSIYKDILIKSMERKIKEVSFDCILTYKRNYVQGYDYERECEYDECKYVCEGSGSYDIDQLYQNIEENIDKSTSQLYYFKTDIKNAIKEQIKKFFSQTFNIKTSKIIQSLLQQDYNGNVFTEFQILTILNDMIADKDIIINKYGLQSILKESNGTVYTSDTLTSYNNKDSVYYTIYPTIKSLKTIDVSEKDEIVIKKLLSTNITSEIETTGLIKSLHPNTQEMLIKYAIASKELLQPPPPITLLILKIFNTHILLHGNVWIISLRKDTQTKTGIISKDRTSINFKAKHSVWKDSFSEHQKILADYSKNKLAIVDTGMGGINPYAIIATKDKKTEFFLKHEKNKKTNEKNTDTKGARCGTHVIHKQIYKYMSNYNKHNTLKFDIDFINNYQARLSEFLDKYKQFLDDYNVKNKPKIFKFIKHFISKAESITADIDRELNNPTHTKKTIMGLNITPVSMKNLKIIIDENNTMTTKEKMLIYLIYFIPKDYVCALLYHYLFETESFATENGKLTKEEMIIMLFGEEQHVSEQGADSEQ
jgi:hypothetical protein